jgi:TATA-box binding protein (TBP) (component of TFIID and TFIIIB)
MTDIKLEYGIDSHINNLLILPKDLSISTIVVTCKANFDFNTNNIGLYFDNYDDILISKHYKKMCYDKDSMHEIKLKSKVVKKNKNFRNQVTLIFDTNKLMNITEEKDKIISVKIFDNGSLQITGCKEIINIKKCISIIFDKIKDPKIIMENGIEKEIYFISDPKMLKLSNISNFNICMINTTFELDYHINRQKLYEELVKNNINTTYDPSNNVSVFIQYNLKSNPSQTVSIFIFETGKINISTNNINHNYEAYMFINKFILERAELILIKPLTKNALLNIIKECKKELNIDC